MSLVAKSLSYTRLLSLIAIAIVCISIVSLYLVHKGRMKNLKSEFDVNNYFHAEKLSDEMCIPVCVSRSCIIQADMLLKSIKPSVDPCENFQEFLCGSYDEKFGRNEGYTVLADMTSKMTNKLKNILENIKAVPESVAAKLKTLYDSCVNLGSSELRGIQDFEQVLNEVEIFNWPYLGADFKFSDDGIPKLLAILRSYFEIEFIGFILAPAFDSKPSEKYVKIDFNDDVFNKIPVIKKEEAADILQYFDMESGNVDELLNDLKVVRSSLLDFSRFVKEYSCKGSCPGANFNCSEPIEDEEWIDVCKMVEIYLNATNLRQHVSTSKIAIDWNYVLYVKFIIPRLKSLPDRSVANFFAFNLLWNHLSEINLFFRLKMQKYYKYFRTLEHEKAIVTDKWKHCVAWITRNAKLMLENEMLKNYFTQPYIDEIHDIHKEHTSTISEMIDGQKWIPSQEKITIKKHIKSLECNMAFNQRLLPNDTYVTTFYQAFNPTPGSFFINILDYQRSLLITYSTMKDILFRKLESKFEAGAFTNYEDEIVFHYGFLMPPAYYPDHEKFINRIQLAHIIGHEVAHNIYRKLDEVSKSSFITMGAILERKWCFNMQFFKFKFRILNEILFAPQYFEENFSDNLGFAVTDKMIGELNSTDEGFLLPGLSFTLEQLLYMSSRQAWCSKNSREMEVYFKTIETHAPSEFRIIASGQNSKGYSEAFTCPAGSYMNPTRKCTSLDFV